MLTTSRHLPYLGEISGVWAFCHAREKRARLVLWDTAAIVSSLTTPKKDVHGFSYTYLKYTILYLIPPRRRGHTGFPFHQAREKRAWVVFRCTANAENGVLGDCPPCRKHRNEFLPTTLEKNAQTVYGALHALETFSQLCYFNFTSKIIELHSAPWKIIDQPRFPYRGLMIDRESFPLEMPSYPNLWNGAYSYSERYTTADALEIVLYAQRRGINVLAEIDVPGHTRSWGLGYPSLWPSFNCREPLDVSNEFTFQVLDGILSDFSKVFKFKFVHLGGDEVNTNGELWATPKNSIVLVNSGNGEEAERIKDIFHYPLSEKIHPAILFISNDGIS
ncbi:Beta-hexosaminidase 3 [Dendrobium catenatum]|uniref:beta-N-acetylhexosaminidase n=1 Tax=Dendrobium catenatum TaxID=906689 RepID=A0A2I0X9S3_9ASPA|nr:Beta-hexosaminidase 3 [Dendrobium catenatum]